MSVGRGREGRVKAENGEGRNGVKTEQRPPQVEEGRCCCGRCSDAEAPGRLKKPCAEAARRSIPFGPVSSLDDGAASGQKVDDEDDERNDEQQVD